MKDNELNEIRQLIELMQSGLVELFEQLRELRERLHLVTGLSSDMPPSIIPLFSEIKSKTEKLEDNNLTDAEEETDDEVAIRTYVPDSPSNPHFETDLQKSTDASSSVEPISDYADPSTTSAKVSRVLDPIAHELRTGEATADIILEYLQAAKEYLIDEDERKKKVERDMDIVLNFLKARGSRRIRTEERDNILKRIRRWKAHLVSYSGSPAE